MKKILLVGESWVSNSTHFKGFDSFQTTFYELGANNFVKALKDNFEIIIFTLHQLIFH